MRGSDDVATRATLPTRRSPEERFDIGVMCSRGRRSFHGCFYERVKMRRELVSPLISIYGWLKASDVDGFFNPTFVPITIP